MLSVCEIKSSSLGEKATENIICASRNANSYLSSEKNSYVLVRWSKILECLKV